MEVFHLPQHLVVPLFQRSYVWDEGEQWLPFWQDVRRLAELRLTQPFSTATHFLGAIVLQAHDHQTGSIPAKNVIDGQQRLTTLQLLMDATGALLEEAGQDALAGQLEALTHNQGLFVTGSESRLKVRHTNRDAAPFDEVMGAEPPVDHAALRHSGALIARAHRFFTSSVAEWLDDFDDPDFAGRANALVQVLTQGLQLVVIDLQAQENSQEIFETLNARGTPLTGADLVKNFVFQRLAAEGVDTRRAYSESWPFERPFWEKEVSVGRYNLSRSSLFLNQWLASRVGEEVSPKSTFTRFKHYVDHEQQERMSDVLVLIKQQADAYQQWSVAAAEPDRALNPTELAIYRMQASDTELLTPVLIWLHEPELAIPSDVINHVIADLESWLIRRQLLRLTSADLGRIVADLIKNFRTAPTHLLAGQVRDYLTRLSSPSTYWPGDDEIRRSLHTENVYRRFRRGRLRMVLEAAEDHLRAAHGSPRVPRRGYPIEHILPQKWDTHWPVDGLEAELNRGAHVHRLGNLTLLTRSLNSVVSNSGWDVKRAKIAEHDTFLLNRPFLRAGSEVWDEDQIDERSHAIIDSLIATWPVPDGHEGRVIEKVPSDHGWVEVKHLVAAGLIAPGTSLIPRPGHWQSREAIVQADGSLRVGAAVYWSPSGAGAHVKGAVTNGWRFWRLADGRKLLDVRAEYRGEKPSTQREKSFDWSPLHEMLEALPEGYWTTYGALADAVGTAAQAVGNHVPGCTHCVNPHRVLTSAGRVADNFRWLAPDDVRDPARMLQDEGVSFVDGRADPSRRLHSDDLAALVAAG
ncbi:DUF262 domain-containing protein [Georgenia satyanarayanai]|nr:DUF262 domain-containing protein [Georgenia satyanarayanai]